MNRCTNSTKPTSPKIHKADHIHYPSTVYSAHEWSPNYKQKQGQRHQPEYQAKRRGAFCLQPLRKAWYVYSDYAETSEIISTYNMSANWIPSFFRLWQGNIAVAFKKDLSSKWTNLFQSVILASRLVNPPCGLVGFTVLRPVEIWFTMLLVTLPWCVLSQIKRHLIIS